MSEELDNKKVEKIKLPQSYGIKQLKSIRYKVFEFVGKWFMLLGKPEKGVTWFIWGNSGNGKSTACAIIAYMLAQNTKVLYLALEEKRGKSIRSKLLEVGFNDDSKNFQLLAKSSYSELVQRLHKRNSEEVIIIDSLQYWGISYKQYQQLIETFPDKTFIFVSHARGKDPKGATADSIHYDAGIKIWVEGGRIEVKHRFEGGGGQMVVIPELAERYWNDDGSRNDEETIRILMQFIIKNKLLSFLRPFVENMGYTLAQLNLKVKD
ncbi:MAG: hypothetical protein QM653_02810 [Dysgonomonas sp.]|uniref:hypothetical protein n=1 Tax=Dysgonomonas sp. TaxID=1891233 RepID=UPI0039E6894C